MIGPADQLRAVTEFRLLGAQDAAAQASYIRLRSMHSAFMLASGAVAGMAAGQAAQAVNR